jgi:hypothetical protein
MTSWDGSAQHGAKRQESAQQSRAQQSRARGGPCSSSIYKPWAHAASLVVAASTANAHKAWSKHLLMCMLMLYPILINPT